MHSEDLLGYCPRWSLTSSGVQIEAKDDGSKNCIKARLGRSPDKGEAVMLSNYIAPLAGWVKNPWENS